MKKILLIFLLFFLHTWFIPVFGQEWGEISDEEWAVKAPADNPDEEAVILFDFGQIRVTNNYTLEMRRHVRIKILTEAGKRYANVKIPFWHEDKVRDIEAVCYQRNDEEYELDEDDIFEEEADKVIQKVFAIPGVEIGSVIEYKYLLSSKYIYRLEPWIFTDKIYTRRSEVRIIIPPGFNYSAILRNYNNYKVEKKQETIMVVGGGGAERQTQYTWIFSDIPGLREEPYINSLDDYKAYILFQIVDIKDRRIDVTVAKTWDDIAEAISRKYDRLIDQDGGIEDFINELIKTTGNPLDKAKILYDWIRTEIKHGEHHGLWSDEFLQPEQVFLKRSGSTAERNLLLINMMTHAGLSVRPLFLSTSKNGRLNPQWVQSQQFNLLIAYLEIDGAAWFLDMANKCCPFGYLTPSSDVENGLLVSGDSGKIIAITPQKMTNKITINTQANILNNGDLQAVTEFEYQGCNAIETRSDLMNTNPEKYVTEKLQFLNPDAVLNSFAIFRADSINQPLKLVLDYLIPGYTEQANDLIYFSTPFFSGIKKNPFFSQTRNLPVDFPFMYTSNEVVRLNFPSGYTLNEAPFRSNAKINKLYFSKIYFSTEQGLECRRSYSLKRKTVSLNEFPELQKMYDEMVESDQAQIIIAGGN